MIRQLGLEQIFIKTLCLIVILGFLTSSCKSIKTDNEFIKTEIYFGLSQNGIEITQNEWDEFKSNTLNKIFSGYTELNCNGFWTDDQNLTVTEKCKLIIYLNKGSRKDSFDIEKVINTYKIMYNQKSVLKINTHANGSF
jgi:hypothetical protein